MWYNLRKQIEEVAKYDYGTPESVKHMKKVTPGENVKEDDDNDPGEYDQEGDMAKTQLRTMMDAAQELNKMLGDNDNLPEWCQNKITKATDYIDSVRDYLKSEKDD
jgi:hypothetical protein